MTAVEWLVEQLAKNGVLHSLDIAKAKEMDKQEKIDFAHKYGTYLLQGGIMSAAAYNETFKLE